MTNEPDIYMLPVFGPADLLPVIGVDRLAELAADIKIEWPSAPACPTDASGCCRFRIKLGHLCRARHANQRRRTGSISAKSLTARNTDRR